MSSSTSMPTNEHFSTVMKTKGMEDLERVGMVGTESTEPLINCVMLVRFPIRSQMIQEAISGFIHQDYQNKVLTIVNDGYFMMFPRSSQFNLY